MQLYGKILLVEDDASLAQWVLEYLQNQGFDVYLEARGDQAIAAYRQCQPDLILLDLMLPGLDGISVCKEIRRISQVPIIMLTAQGEELDEVIGLEVGANDYLVKPVRPRALLARIKGQLQRSESGDKDNQSHILQFGTLSLNRDANRTLLDGQEIELSSNEFAMLWYLASHAGRIINREEAFRELKGREYDGLDRWFDVMISVLRKKLGDDTDPPKRIKTAWGKGYLFVADAWDVAG
ncbi:response regulator transcription factor [Bowmanella yangjiangensis]|uniref:Response regulator transcription factor n=1 Tax=Bowmanella yangjiangensis TaxID=2811230 RepID=A0ABS3CQQ4_9ALTE|nr:response regulator transcription factor [Bowmanella yangjiangensis]MBN7819418.1 response regulator transcription factor [Bowmanella yangjiangensis]